MANADFIPKFAGLFVALILVLVVAVPVVSTMATSTETTHEEVDYGDNQSALGYTSSIVSVMHSDTPTDPWAGVNDPGTLITVGPRYLCTLNNVYIGGNSYYSYDIWYYDTTEEGWTTFTLPDDTTGAITFDADGENIPELDAYGLICTAVWDWAGSGTLWRITADTTDYSLPDLCIPFMHDVIADVGDSNPTKVFFQASTMTFVDDPDTTYVSVPSLLIDSLRVADRTLKVAEGAKYYAPDENGQLTAFIAPGYTGIDDSFNLTFTSAGDDNHYFTLGNSPTADSYENLYVPYDVIYTHDETVTVEIIPMGDLLVAILILFAVILAVGLLARNSGGF